LFIAAPTSPIRHSRLWILLVEALLMLDLATLSPFPLVNHIFLAWNGLRPPIWSSTMTMVIILLGTFFNGGEGQGVKGRWSSSQWSTQQWRWE
jgi:hypothetical protein